MQHRSGILKAWILAGTALLVLAGLTSQVQAASLEVKAMYPAGAADLQLRQPVHVLLEYTAEQPVRIWVRPYDPAIGEAAPCATHGSPVYPPSSGMGSGVASGWLDCDDGTRVEALRIQMQPATGVPPDTTPLAEVIVPVSYRWSASASPVHTTAPPAWIAEQRQHRKDLSAAWASSHPPEEAGWGFSLLLMLVPLYFVATLIFSLFWGIRWRSGWRWLARLPALAYGLIMLNICVGVMLDATSHNLWPFELLLVSVVAGPYLFLVWLIRRGALRRQTAHT